MKPLGSLLCVLFAIFLKTSCGSSYNELDQKDLEALRDIWFNAISKRSNESLSKQSDEFKQLIDVLSKLNPSGNKQNIFRDMKNVMLKNAREKTFGIFTNFCGPGNLSGQSTVCGVFNGVDECCKAHDSCEHYIASFTSFTEYQKFYPKLAKKRLYFSSLICDCDVAFYNCIKQTSSTFGELILSIYSIAQSSCFKYEYVSKCSKYDDSLIFPKRCLEYKINKQAKSAWQWFDLPYSNSSIPEYYFPVLKV